jgi:hypothetical protein
MRAQTRVLLLVRLLKHAGNAHTLHDKDKPNLPVRIKRSIKSDGTLYCQICSTLVNQTCATNHCLQRLSICFLSAGAASEWIEQQAMGTHSGSLDPMQPLCNARQFKRVIHALCQGQSILLLCNLTTTDDIQIRHPGPPQLYASTAALQHHSALERVARQPL